MEHTPVLLHECIEGLNIIPDGIYVDGTLGRAGHSLEIVKNLAGGRLLAIDRDEEALDKAEKILSDYKDRTTLIHGNFKDIEKILNEEGVEKVDGMLFDFGVSSPQLDNALRGFSYMHDAKLDMRMDKQEELTASDVINNWNEEDLRGLFYKYGEER